MIKISHESPLSIMGLVSSLTDYDYCLPHLLDLNEDYRDYFIQAKYDGRYIVMDNSLHELGHAYETERLLYWVSELEPNEFIVPDVWENKSYSLKKAFEWSKILLPKDTLKVPVVQVRFEEEFEEVYKTYKDLGYTKIAFTYGSSVYNTVFPHRNPLISKMLGRVKIIFDLIKRGIIEKDDKIHLLGCSLPNEFIYYQNVKQIESIDTSNPVMLALEGKSYGVWDYGEIGIDFKPLSNMNNSFSKNKLEINLNLVKNNILTFKLMNKL